MGENGVPFIHPLNIKDLSVKWGLPLKPGTKYGKAEGVYFVLGVNKFAVMFMLAFITVLLVLLKIYQIRNKQYFI